MIYFRLLLLATFAANWHFAGKRTSKFWASLRTWAVLSALTAATAPTSFQREEDNNLHKCPTFLSSEPYQSTPTLPWPPKPETTLWLNFKCHQWPVSLKNLSMLLVGNNKKIIANFHNFLLSKNSFCHLFKSVFEEVEVFHSLNIQFEQS